MLRPRHRDTSYRPPVMVRRGIRRRRSLVEQSHNRAGDVRVCHKLKEEPQSQQSCSQLPPRSLEPINLSAMADKARCGCPLNFDPVHQTDNVDCCVGLPSLLTLARCRILQCIPLERLAQASVSLPLPVPLTREVCKLRLQDFIISPYSQPPRHAHTGQYSAVYRHSGLQVMLTSHRPPRHARDMIQPGTIYRFEDQGLLFSITKPSISLNEMIQAHERVGRPLSVKFMWQVIEAMAKYALAMNKVQQSLKISDVQVRNNDIFVCISKKDEYNDDNESLDLGIVSQTGTRDKVIGKQYKQTRSAYSGLLQVMLATNMRIEEAQNSRHARLLYRKCYRQPFLPQRVMVTGQTLEADIALRSLCHQVSHKEDRGHPDPQSILSLAQWHLGDHRHSAVCHSPRQLTTVTARLR